MTEGNPTRRLGRYLADPRTAVGLVAGFLSAPATLHTMSYLGMEINKYLTQSLPKLAREELAVAASVALVASVVGCFVYPAIGAMTKFDMLERDGEFTSIWKPGFVASGLGLAASFGILKLMQ